MSLTPLDWLILAGFLLFPAAIALSVAGRAGRNLRQYFLAGGDLPWWLAGTSMVATTFAADTPLAVTGIVARDGVAGNWIWWNGALGGMLSVLFLRPAVAPRGHPDRRRARRDPLPRTRRASPARVPRALPGGYPSTA